MSHKKHLMMGKNNKLSQDLHNLIVANILMALATEDFFKLINVLVSTVDHF